MEDGTQKMFATAINCIDGRVQMPVIEYIQKHFGVQYVDMITEEGPNKILSENSDIIRVGSILRKVRISVERHDSKLIAITGHYDCANNPTDQHTQISQVNDSIKTVKSWGVEAEIIGLWINEQWRVSSLSLLSKSLV